MTQAVKIRLENKQLLTGETEENKIIKNYQGQLQLKNSKIYLKFKDHSEGLAGARTVIKIDPAAERMLLLREDPAALKQDFSVGEKETGYFKTEYGSIDLAVKTSSLEFDLAATKGIIKINYQLFLAGSLNAEHYLKLSYSVLEED
ncbi:DUF1934 domain-containing protein [Halanaerobium salsuginis]|jgi:uncharacterized beta-barrel protein YwiB (DUF1934 family)|uniref:Uncharacterized beta-barrel protein YwiB, DUF1934 family n=1 Tax=Halanaerobium salsuginis TaxID=29563 RepID=A0A1I4FJ35_9FIRM|nr:DUF1934 domain-containing protein [Halanaerobium salsuginis]SFL17310.1 Uncharacterized beta-barrel protein YwiB, DUF1934 family [Halanaerobium salsuginis]